MINPRGRKRRARRRPRQAMHSQRKGGQCSCGNGESCCCCRSGADSWTSPPPPGWPPPILVCRVTHTHRAHIIIQSRKTYTQVALQVQRFAAEYGNIPGRTSGGDEGLFYVLLPYFYNLLLSKRHTRYFARETTKHSAPFHFQHVTVGGQMGATQTPIVH